MSKRVFVFAAALALLAPVAVFAGGAAEDEEVSELGMFLDPEREELAIPAIEAFEEDFGVTVNSVTVPYDNVFDQMSAQIAGGAELDVVFMSNSWHAEMGAAGFLLPLDDYLTDEDLANYVDAGLEMMTSGGTLWGLPAQPAILYFYYNADMLSELGYDAPPASWEEVERISIEAMEAGLADHGLNVGMAPLEGLMVYYDSFLKQFGGQWINDDQTEWVFNSEEAIAAGEFMREMIEKGVFNPGGLETPDRDTMSSFLAGRAPFHWNWTFAWREFLNPEISTVVDAVTPALVPAVEAGTGETYTVMGGGGFAIASTTRNPEMAVELLKYITGPIAAEYIIEAFGSEAGWAPALEDPALQDRFPLLRVYEEQVQYGGYRPSDYLTWYSEFRDNMFLPRFHDALSGNRSMRDALNAAQEEAQARLESEGI